MLEATDLGIGRVWIYSLDAEIIKLEFNLPENLELINILALGYSSGIVPRTDRHDRSRMPLNGRIIYETNQL